MATVTKATLASYFETGDKPTQAQFSDLIDTLVARPSAATGVIEVVSSASSRGRSVGTFGASMLAVAATADANNLLGLGTAASFSNAGAVFVSAATTAAQQALLNLPTTPNVDWISGQIDTPASSQYVLDEYAPVAYTIQYLAAKLSAGACDLTGQINTTNITGIVSATQGAARVISSAAGANAVAVGDRVRLMVTNTSSPALLAFTMKVVRT